MLYNLVDAQGIQAMVNTGTSTSSPTPLVSTTPSLTPSLTPSIKAYTFVREVDHLMAFASTLVVEELTSPSVSEKRNNNPPGCGFFKIDSSY